MATIRALDSESLCVLIALEILVRSMGELVTELMPARRQSGGGRAGEIAGGRDVWQVDGFQFQAAVFEFPGADGFSIRRLELSSGGRVCSPRAIPLRWIITDRGATHAKPLSLRTCLTVVEVRSTAELLVWVSPAGRAAQDLKDLLAGAGFRHCICWWW